MLPRRQLQALGRLFYLSPTGLHRPDMRFSYQWVVAIWLTAEQLRHVTLRHCRERNELPLASADRSKSNREDDNPPRSGLVQHRIVGRPVDRPPPCVFFTALHEFLIRVADIKCVLRSI